MSQSAGSRVNPVFKAMNRPLTVLGAERRLFFVALISGGAVFSLLHSLLGGIGLFIVGVIVARIATKHDVEILRVLFNSSKFRRRYDHEVGARADHYQEPPPCSGLATSRRTGKKRGHLPHRSTFTVSGTSTAF